MPLAVVRLFNRQGFIHNDTKDSGLFYEVANNFSATELTKLQGGRYILTFRCFINNPRVYGVMSYFFFLTEQAQKITPLRNAMRMHEQKKKMWIVECRVQWKHEPVRDSPKFGVYPWTFPHGQHLGIHIFDLMTFSSIVPR